ncbi:MAG TPA: sigma-70 family RNA polymerase sigma factor [Rhodocyclaceae bacterium]|jgi:RNA polymerase sigma factor (sigma-70 family)|nr:sigma-70 family RNA polymerase sigma factor [Rhodocyclaceae bacterium]
MDSALIQKNPLFPRAQMALQDSQISETIRREQGRLRQFIRRRVFDAAEVEDILQDVFFAFVEAYRLPMPIEQAGAWLARVARNRIIDRFRKKREAQLPLPSSVLLEREADAEESHWLEQMLPMVDDGPEAAYSRACLLDAITLALEALPEKQRDVFVAHEIDGLSFKEIAASTGIPVNTLLGQKRLAIQRLRSKLQAIYDEL